MAHTELYLHALTDDRVPVAPLWAGLISNAQETTVSGLLRLAGPIDGATPDLGELSVGPGAFDLGSYDSMLDAWPWSLTVPEDAEVGVYHSTLSVRRSGTVVGHFVVTVAVLDLAAADTDDLLPPPIVDGAPALLQVGDFDFVTVTP